MLYFILVATVLVANAVGVENCPAGWKEFERTCFKKWDGVASFYDAKALCQRANADLIKIKSAAQMDFVSKEIFTSKYGWIGVSDQNKDGKFTYADGSPLGYTNWAKGEPNNYRGIEQCVMLKRIPRGGKMTNEWNDVRCNVRVSFACSMDKTPIKSVDLAFDGPCPEGYKHFTVENTCYKLYSQTKSFNDAVKACRAEKTELAQVKNTYQKAFILHLRTFFPIWIGVARYGNPKEFRYISGGAYLGEYHPWNDGEPNNANGRENCVMMFGNGPNIGGWNDDNCLKKYNYVCSTPARVSRCSEGWSYYPADNTCIKSFSERKSFMEARKICKAAKPTGDLVKVRNEAQKDFIVGLGVPMMNWIGTIDGGKMVYRYIDGSKLGDYKPWNKGEPNNYKGREHCALMYGQGPKGGKWNDANCGMPIPFICSAKNE